MPRLRCVGALRSVALCCQPCVPQGSPAAGPSLALGAPGTSTPSFRRRALLIIPACSKAAGQGPLGCAGTVQRKQVFSTRPAWRPNCWQQRRQKHAAPARSLQTSDVRLSLTCTPTGWTLDNAGLSFCNGPLSPGARCPPGHRGSPPPLTRIRSPAPPAMPPPLCSPARSRATPAPPQRLLQAVQSEAPAAPADMAAAAGAGWL